jgi:hypothetical protein
MAAHSGPGLTGNTQSITTTSAVVAAQTNYSRTVVIQNIDPTNPIYIGGSSGAVLTAANGFRIAAGESFAVDLPPFTEVYAISGGTVEARFLVFDGVQGF